MMRIYIIQNLNPMPSKSLAQHSIQWVTTEDGSITGYRTDLRSTTSPYTVPVRNHATSLLKAAKSAKRPVRGLLESLIWAWVKFFTNRNDAAHENRTPLLYIGVDFQPPTPEHIPTDQAYAHLIQEALDGVQTTGKTTEVTEGQITLRLHARHWNLLAEETIIDAAYHDPFAPADNPEAWTEACFQWWKKWLNPNARLATYSAAGHVRRALAAAGFWVARAPGPGRKREITIASPSREALAGFDIMAKHRPQ